MGIGQGQTLARQWRVYELLRSRRRGLSVASLCEHTGLARATLYRYLRVLGGAFPIYNERVNGEVRYRLLDDALPACALNVDELAALAIARQMLGPLEGTRIVETLDSLLRRFAPRAAAPGWLSLSGSPGETDKGALRAIDLAIREGHRLAFSYRSERRLVDPVAVRVHRRQPYLVAFDIERADWRTFKLVRIEPTIEIAGLAEPRPDYDEAALFDHSVGVWSGDPVEIVVRLAPAVADRAAEYPLTADQWVEPNGNGSVSIRARVAGLVEVTRWILSWGASAEAISPPELREAVAAELAAAASRYGENVSHTGETAPGEDGRSATSTEHLQE